MDYEDEIEQDVDSIIAQIKNQGKSLKKAEREKIELRKEDLEKFIIDNAASVVSDSIDMIQSIKVDVLAGADSKTIEAAAELVKAVTGAIDSLSKLKLSDDKLSGQKELKKMELDAKIENLQNNQQGLFISREEIFKRLFDEKKIENKTEEPDGVIDI